MRMHPILTLAVAALLAAWPVMAQQPEANDKQYAVVTPAAVRIDAATHAVLITVGPLSVQGGPYDEMEDMVMDGDQVFRAAWPANGFLHGYSYTIHDSLGRPVTGVELHHAGIANLGRRELLHPILQRIVAAGKETDPVELPSSVGVPMHAGDSLAVYAMLHNRTDADVRGVYITFRMPFTPEKRRGNPVAVWPMHFEVNFVEGGTTAFDLAPGVTVRQDEFTMPVSGHLLALGGHVHDYARSLRLVDCANGRTLATLKPHKRKDGTVTGLSRFVFGFRDAGLHLERGHRYRVIVVYDNPSGKVIKNGGMASLGGPLQVDDMRDWPAMGPDRAKIDADVRTL